MLIDAPAKILVVDDEASNIMLINNIFGDKYKVLFAMDGKKALDIAIAENPEVILLDVMMPEMDGYEVFKQIKKNRLINDIPVIFITGLGDAEAETRGLELGAMDYISKPFNPAVVKVRVHNQIEFKRARDKLKHIAITDGLTGLNNRGRFDELLEYEFLRHQRTRKELGLILMDIDHFKNFNDHYGHTSGDECLRQVAGAIKKTVSRKIDIAARYGGEEFICILPEIDDVGITVLANKIRKNIMALNIPHHFSTAAEIVTASFGAVVSSCNDKITAVEIVNQADTQLYKAKEAGRNKIFIADSNKTTD